MRAHSSAEREHDRSRSATPNVECTRARGPGEASRFHSNRRMVAAVRRSQIGRQGKPDARQYNGDQDQSCPPPRDCVGPLVVVELDPRLPLVCRFRRDVMAGPTQFDFPGCRPGSAGARSNVLRPYVEGIILHELEREKHMGRHETEQGRRQGDMNT